MGMFNLHGNSTLLTFCFTFLVFGQVIDNIAKVKMVFVWCELVLTFTVLTMAFGSYFDQHIVNSGTLVDFQESIWDYYLVPTSVFVLGSIQLIQTI